MEAKKLNVTDDELYIHIDTVVRKAAALVIFLPLLARFLIFLNNGPIS